jgi:hypothetical protein
MTGGKNDRSIPICSDCHSTELALREVKNDLRATDGADAQMVASTSYRWECLHCGNRFESTLPGDRLIPNAHPSANGISTDLRSY